MNSFDSRRLDRPSQTFSAAPVRNPFRVNGMSTLSTFPEARRYAPGSEKR